MGLYAPQNSIHGRSYINPLTNTMGCPAGASSIQIFGSAVDAPLFLCFSLNPSESRYLFGGIFSTNHHVNPATNDLSCPAGYQRSQIYGDPVFDFPLYVCFKNRTSETEIDSVPFGGIFGESSGGIYFKNPFANNLRSCPAKTKPFEMLNYTGTDYPLWLCSQPPGMAQ